MGFPFLPVWVMVAAEIATALPSDQFCVVVSKLIRDYSDLYFPCRNILHMLVDMIYEGKNNAL